MARKTWDVQQGTEEWLKLRKDHYPASLAAAAMGISKYMSRSELIEYLATGKEQERSDYTKKVIFVRGHKVEESARLIIESRICEDLYPVVMTNDKLLASVDGMTINGDMIFEHKQFNRKLYESVSGGILPDEFMPQVQQCLMVTGADKCMFVVSDGTHFNMATILIRPHQEYQDRIVKAWEQVQVEVDAYVPEKPVQNVIANNQEFPIAVHAVVSGAVTESNVKDMELAAIDFFDNVNKTLETDQDFADAEALIKFCKKVEDKMKSAEEGILNQTLEINELLGSLRNIKSLASKNRLFFDKEVKSRKETIKAEMIADVVSKWNKHVAGLDADLHPATLSRSHDFHGVIKGLKTTKSVKNALNSHLAELIIAANEQAEKLRINIDWFRNFTVLFKADVFRDLTDIVQHDHEAFKAICNQRRDTYNDEMKAVIAKKEAELKEIVEEVKATVERVKYDDIPCGNLPAPDRAPESDRAITDLYNEMIKHCTPEMSVPSAVSKIAELIVKGEINVR